jgi:organic hydroperoxide reductase OsmC/OhrA
MQNMHLSNEWPHRKFGAEVKPMSTGPAHHYTTRLVWEGNLGTGTSAYTGYSRRFRVSLASKPDISGSADPAFLGEPDLPNPEDLLVAALSSCHMLAYLALCSRRGITVVDYTDDAHGVMNVSPDGGGRFESVMLRPRVSITDPAMQALAVDLHERAHALCFIAASCNFPVRNSPTVVVENAGERTQ